MRLWPATLKILVVCLAAVSFGAARADSGPLVLQTWGGVWQKTFEQIAVDYKAKTGQQVNVVVQPTSDAGLARVIAQRARPQVDIWTINQIQFWRAIEAGVLAPLPKNLKYADTVPENLRYSHGIAAWISQRGMFYRKDLVPFEPTKWEDLWDPRFKGKMAAPAASFDAGYFPLIASVVAGGNERQMDQGFAKLKELRPNIASYYKSNAQTVQLLEAGEVALIAFAPLPNVIHLLGPDSKFGFAIPKPSFVGETPVTLVAGSPRPQAAQAFMEYMLSPEIQEILARDFGSTPANRNAKAPAIVRQLMPTMEHVYTVDYKYLSKEVPTIIDRYNREVMN